MLFVCNFLIVPQEVEILIAMSLFFAESLRAMLVCGSDLLQSFNIPGFWIPEQVYAYISLYDIGVIGLREYHYSV